MTDYPTFGAGSSPRVRPFRREGRPWRFEFPYMPSSIVSDSQPRYCIRRPEMGLWLDAHVRLIEEPYRT
jgi:hypothetical protein